MITQRQNRDRRVTQREEKNEGRRDVEGEKVIESLKTEAEKNRRTDGWMDGWGGLKRMLGK